jgi:hypothetical protein
MTLLTMTDHPIGTSAKGWRLIRWSTQIDGYRFPVRSVDAGQLGVPNRER